MSVRFVRAFIDDVAVVGAVLVVPEVAAVNWVQGGGV